MHLLPSLTIRFDEVANGGEDNYFEHIFNNENNKNISKKDIIFIVILQTAFLFKSAFTWLQFVGLKLYGKRILMQCLVVKWWWYWLQEQDHKTSQVKTFVNLCLKILIFLRLKEIFEAGILKGWYLLLLKNTTYCFVKVFS